MQNLHYDSKDSESRLKIDVRIAFTLDSRGNGATSGVRVLCCFKNTQMGLCEVISTWMTARTPAN